VAGRRGILSGAGRGDGAGGWDEAEQNLSRLVDAVLSGERVVIAQSGKPVVRLVPVEPLVAVRHFGALKGTVHIGCDFDAPLPGELIAQFEGS
jgi:prevent-host-death family protein